MEDFVENQALTKFYLASYIIYLIRIGEVKLKDVRVYCRLMC